MANDTGNTTNTISRSERTNAKNLENLHIANTIVASVGADYLPKNPSIDKTELTEFEANFLSKTEDVLTAQIAEQNATDAQIAAFKPVSKRVSLIMKAVRAHDLGEEFIGHLQSNVYRLNGVRINKATPDTTPEGETGSPPPQTASVSRRSYAGILESLRIFVEQLKSKPEYNPNEPQYKTAAIEAWVNGLGDLHDAALDSKVATRTARSTRNAYAYNETDGLLPRMTALKNYLGYILDKDDPRLKQLKSLKFVDNTR